jgi:hypothetical protein
MKKYQIEALFYNIGWEVPNDQDLELFDTKEEAEAELADFLDGLEYAVKMGYMEDMEAHDWRVAEVEVE